MKKIFSLLLITSFSLLVSSCYYDEFDEIDNGTNSGVKVSYTADVAPIWGQCVGCHNGNQSPNLSTNSYQNLINGYVIPGNSGESKLYNSLIGAKGVAQMPPDSQLSSTKINLVKNWIDQGAKNN